MIFSRDRSRSSSLLTLAGKYLYEDQSVHTSGCWCWEVRHRTRVHSVVIVSFCRSWLSPTHSWREGGRTGHHQVYHQPNRGGHGDWGTLSGQVNDHSPLLFSSLAGRILSRILPTSWSPHGPELPEGQYIAVSCVWSTCTSLVGERCEAKVIFTNTNPFAVSVTTLRYPWSLLQDNNTINDPVQDASRKERRREESAGGPLFSSCILLICLFTSELVITGPLRGNLFCYLSLPTDYPIPRLQGVLSLKPCITL